MVRTLPNPTSFKIKITQVLLNFIAHFLNKDLTNPINKRLILAFAHDTHWSARAVAIGPLARSASSKQEAATVDTDRCLPWSVYEYGFNMLSGKCMMIVQR